MRTTLGHHNLFLKSEGIGEAAKYTVLDLGRSHDFQFTKLDKTLEEEQALLVLLAEKGGKKANSASATVVNENNSCGENCRHMLTGATNLSSGWMLTCSLGIQFSVRAFTSV